MSVTDWEPDDGEKVECPWCHHMIGDLFDHGWIESYADQIVETECESCGKDIVIKCVTSVNYWIGKPDGTSNH